MSDTSGERYIFAGSELLPNKEWHEIVPVRMEENRAAGIPSSVIICDLNYFKSINDTYTHVEGDRVIKEVGDIIASLANTLRTGTNRRLDPEREVNTDRRADNSRDLVALNDTSDDIPLGIDAIAAQAGGDEFAIYAATDEAGAEIIKERLRKVFNEQFLTDPKNLHLNGLDISIAIGTSTLRADMTPTDVFQKADDSMKEDKLAQLPDFSEEQLEAIALAERLLMGAGVKIADFHKRSRQLAG